MKFICENQAKEHLVSSQCQLEFVARVVLRHGNGVLRKTL